MPSKMPKKPSKVTTSATKHKLPLPKGHPQRAKPKKRKPKLSLGESMVDGLRATRGKPFTTPSPIAGHSLDGIGSAPLEVARAIPCGEDTPLGGTFPFVWVDCSGLEARQGTEYPLHVPPPDTSSYPWPLKWAWKVDGWMVATRKYVGSQLSRLAQWVTPK